MTKHPLFFVALLSLLSVVAALIILHFSPGEQGGQLEGVAITQVSVLEEDGGEIPLSDGLSRRLVALLRQYDRLSYSAAAKRSADGASLGEDPAYAQWRQDLAAYLNP